MNKRQLHQIVPYKDTIFQLAWHVDSLSIYWIAKVLSTAERARQRCARQEYRLSLEKEVIIFLFLLFILAAFFAWLKPP